MSIYTRTAHSYTFIERWDGEQGGVRGVDKRYCGRLGRKREVPFHKFRVTVIYILTGLGCYNASSVCVYLAYLQLQDEGTTGEDIKTGSKSGISLVHLELTQASLHTCYTVSVSALTDTE